MVSKVLYSDTDSILETIKKKLNVASDYTAFDVDIISHINTVFAKLNQLGVGPSEPFYISGSDETWGDFTDDPKYNMVRSYMWFKVRLMFDPPSTTTMYEAFQRQAEELEWRLYMLGDSEEI